MNVYFFTLNHERSIKFYEKNYETFIDYYT